METRTNRRPLAPRSRVLALLLSAGLSLAIFTPTAAFAISRPLG